MNWIIRPPQEQDIPFVYATWLRSYHVDTDYIQMMRKSTYFENYRLVLDHILSSADTDIVCLKDTPEVILGYLISQPKTIHYIFVKDAFRHLGIAEDLISKRFPEDQEITCTHATKSILPFLKRNTLINFNPFTLYKGI